MELKIFLMADYASISIDQKLSISGVFQAINAQQFPATHSLLYLVAQLKVPPAEFGRQFRLQIKLLDQDANVLTEVSMMATAPTPPIRGTGAFINQIVQLGNIVFPKPGPYQFSLLVDGDEKGELELEVNQIVPRA